MSIRACGHSDGMGEACGGCFDVMSNKLSQEQARSRRLLLEGTKFHDYYKAHGIIDCGCEYDIQKGQKNCEFSQALADEAGV